MVYLPIIMVESLLNHDRTMVKGPWFNYHGRTMVGFIAVFITAKLKKCDYFKEPWFNHGKLGH